MNNLTEWMKSSAFALALATILGFLLAYVLEAGHATYFNIPRSFISTAFNQLWDSLIRFLRFYLPPILITYLLLALAKNPSSQSSITIIVILVVGLIIISLYTCIWFLVRSCIPKKAPWNIGDIKIELFVVSLSMVALMLIIFIKLHCLFKCSNANCATLILSLLFCLFLLPLAFFLGRIDAKTQTTYLVTQITQKDHETPQPFVVLRIYSDKFICALLEEGQVNNRTVKVLDQTYRITGRTHNLFKIIRVTGDEKQLFELNNTGPLSPSN